MVRDLTLLMIVVVLLGFGAATAEAGRKPANAKEQSAVNVATDDALKTLNMKTFTLTNVSDKGTFLVVDADCTRVIRGATTKYAVRWYITIVPPARGQTVGRMEVTSRSIQTLK